MHIAILGRQPALGIAELERVFTKVSWFSNDTALVDTDTFDIERLGGTQKAGRVVLEIPRGDWRTVSMKIVQHYTKEWAGRDGKVTVGLSAYGFPISARDVQKTGLILKSKVKSGGVSVRLIPNQEPALNTAASHHNKLGLSDNKIELIIVRGTKGQVIVAESTGAQNITSIAARDQARPKRDAFVGMLPPKLAQMMINLALGSAVASSGAALRGATPARGARLALTGTSPSATTAEPSLAILDPFCGTGVILQEALLLGIDAYGSDLNPKMIDYTGKNLEWLKEKFHADGEIRDIREGDAMSFAWKEASAIDAVVAETYLGQPFSAPPSSSKLTEVRGNCNHIISQFLKNIGTQLPAGTPLCLAVPAWKDTYGNFTHLQLVDNLEKLGYDRVKLKNVTPDQLLYFRPDQVVARELLVLVKI